MKKFVLLFLTWSAVCCGEDELNLLIAQEEISERLGQVAHELNDTYREEELTIVMVMKGAVCLAADLIRHLEMPCTLEYVRASSYGANGVKRGELKIIGLDELDLTSKHVLLVDDIFDTGNTMAALVDKLRKKNPKSLKTMVLLLKDVPHVTPDLPDYALFKIQDCFVVGYGLDYKELYRGLPGIYYFAKNTPPVAFVRVK